MKKENVKYLKVIVLGVVFGFIAIGVYQHYINNTWEHKTVYGNLITMDYAYSPSSGQGYYILNLDWSPYMFEERPDEHYNWGAFEGNFVRVDYYENLNGDKLLADVTNWKTELIG